MFPSALEILFLCSLALFGHAVLPDKIYGVNLGSWLVLEPWMLPKEWMDMGGNSTCDCAQLDCIKSEYALVRTYPETADATFASHWNTWFNQKDVDDLKRVGINTVRIPLGYWIVEPLVQRKTEFYPRGGLWHLKRGLRQLQKAGIFVILDHHALPGVQSPNQMFTGRCTTDVEFYTDFNYGRALQWTAVMTVLSHLDPDFATVQAIEAVNEPIMDASMTPGYGDFQKDFVKVVRAVELSLGIFIGPNPQRLRRSIANATAAIELAGSDDSMIPDATIRGVLLDTAVILPQIAAEFEIEGLMASFESQAARSPLITSFMDINWQNNHPANPRDAKLGPQLYDNHLYYSFGGVADANEKAYLKSICNLNRVEADAALGNSPLVFGEWGLPTQFKATDVFLMKWADAQKRAYMRGAGWIFWNFKIEISPEAGDLARQWSYMEGVRRGYLTLDPSGYNDASVCDPYI